MTLLTANVYWRKLLFLLFFFTSHQLLAETIHGKVLDANNGEPLVGATVLVDGTNLKTVVKLDGTFF